MNKQSTGVLLDHITTKEDQVLVWSELDFHMFRLCQSNVQIKNKDEENIASTK